MWLLNQLVDLQDYNSHTYNLLICQIYMSQLISLSRVCYRGSIGKEITRVFDLYLCVINTKSDCPKRHYPHNLTERDTTLFVCK